MTDPSVVFRQVIISEAMSLTNLALELDAPAIRAAVSLIAECRGVCVTGVGKSGHVARKVAATMASLGTIAYFVHPTDAAHGDLGMIDPRDCVLAFSRSGNTSELVPMLRHTSRVIGVTCRADSELARAAEVVLLMPDLDEACINKQAPTTSTAMQLAIGDALAVTLSSVHGFKPDDFRAIHPAGALGAVK